VALLDDNNPDVVFEIDEDIVDNEELRVKVLTFFRS
jgi:hypothetical protein